MKNKKNGLLCILMTIMTVVSCSVTPLQVYAAVDLSANVVSDNEDDQTPEASNDDHDMEAAEEKEYIRIEIGSAEDLNKLSEDCRLDSYSADKYVVLTDDIVLAGSGYVPIPVFCGVFDGNGHRIDGMIYTDSKNFAGLIGRTSSGAVIKNLTVGGNITPSGKQMVLGGIVGDNYGSIINCKFIGIVKGNDYVGGITGYNESTGIISDCGSFGVITGQHYTGGIAGDNAGGIYRCVNETKVNTTNEDKALKFDDISVDKYLSGILDISGKSKEAKEVNAANSVIDCGGIAGNSSGVIEYCDNNGDIGYEHVGYNVGGIAGRQSGFIHGCVNTGHVLGRKDVGGIAGQAEPYISLDLTEDLVSRLTDGINELHNLIDVTLNDSNDRSDVISDRLSIIQKFTNDALDNVKFLAGDTITWANGITGAANDLMGRLDYAVDEAGKDNGAIEQGKSAANNVSNAADSLSKAAEAANIYGYMSEEEKTRYDAAKQRIKDNTEKYNGYYKEVYKRYYNLYIDSYRRDTTKSYYDAAVGLSAMDLIAYDANGNKIYDDNDTGVASWPNSAAYTDYSEDIDSLKHADDSAFPATGDTDAAKYEGALASDAADNANTSATAYANTKYPTYAVDIENDTKIITEIIADHEKEMTSDATESTKEAMNSLSEASDNLAKASSELDGIADNLSKRDDITLPSLDDNYRARTNAFMAALQGMSDNMGQLNGELNGSSEILTDDMKKVNDSFNSVMLLFADAIDGALDGDTQSIYEDESIKVASTSIDGVIAGCTNKGRIEGDIDTAGIAGAMAIEYDFDLEGDRTGIEDSKAGAVYKTKCILRDNINDGRIMGGKSYAGGMTGRQEMGIIFECENYGRVKSASGDYVGGIAGSSVSDIRKCYDKGILSGGKYVGGIAGYAHNISDCVAMPSIADYEEYGGAIAGEVSDEYSIHDNCFCSDTLGGIDRISYEKMARPVSYEELKTITGLPLNFGRVRVSFLTDNEKEAGSVELAYGKSISLNDYPTPDVKAGNYIKWETDSVENITQDIEIEGSECRLYTTIAGDVLRDNGQSAILADGGFKEDQKLIATLDESDVDVYEHWNIEIPDDGSPTHQIRIQIPEELKDYEIYTDRDGRVSKVVADEMGIYKIFTAEGNKFDILIIEKDMPVWLRVVQYSVAGLIVLAIVVIIVRVCMKKRTTTKKMNEAGQEKVEESETEGEEDGDTK